MLEKLHTRNLHLCNIDHGWARQHSGQRGCRPRSGASSCSTPPRRSSRGTASTPSRSRRWRPIVYGHFNDLPGLLEALVDREGTRALGQLAEVLPRDLASGDPRENLLAGLRGYLAAAEADPVTWRLVLMPPEGAPDVLRERVTAGRAAVLAQLAEAIGGGFGPSVSPDPELTARMLSTLADESARLVLTDPERYPPERVVEHARWSLGLLSPR
jgi:AcrR family transcriptional regulator